MPKTATWPPPIKVHKGYARCHWNDQYYHLGKAGSEAANRAYVRLLGTWKMDPTHKPTARELLVGELARDYVEAAPFPPTQAYQYGRILDLLLESYTDVPVPDFGPVQLRAWLLELAAREHTKGARTGERVWSRTYLNVILRVVRGVWKWGVSSDRVLNDHYQRLQTVDPLKKYEARPGRKVRPVGDGDVTITLEALPRSVRGLVRLQRATGARPSELFGLRPMDIDRTRATWSYTPAEHKTADHGTIRVIHFGPKAQAVLKVHEPGVPSGLYFPVELRQYPPRIVPVYGSEVRRRANEKARRTPRPIGQAYTAGSYRTAVKRACRRLGVPVWTPYQLRHARATELRASHGLEAAGVTLGHKRMSATEVYAQQDRELAARVAAETG